MGSIDRLIGIDDVIAQAARRTLDTLTGDWEGELDLLLSSNGILEAPLRSPEDTQMFDFRNHFCTVDE